MESAQDEISRGERFAFGKNWKDFARGLDDAAIAKARHSLMEMLDEIDLTGRSFLDIGCGSGLFSLAAHQVGARVVSFDFDIDSVECTAALRDRFAEPTPNWDILQGSVLDRQLMESLGTFDIVYSWGVLHHTGDLWLALEHAAARVAPSGLLYIAVYNNQGLRSRLWARVKKLYVSSGSIPRWLLLGFVWLRIELARVIVRVIKRGLRMSASDDRRRRDRGMNHRNDLVDWVGGWPFEVARPEEVFDFLKARGFRLERMITVAGGWGCNEFVFTRWEDRITT